MKLLVNSRSLIIWNKKLGGRRRKLRLRREKRRQNPKLKEKRSRQRKGLRRRKCRRKRNSKCKYGKEIVRVPCLFDHYPFVAILRQHNPIHQIINPSYE